MRTLELEAPRVREANADGTLTLEGMAVPYGEEVDYLGWRESFAANAFDPEKVAGTPMLWSHQRDEPVGHITAATNTPEGLMVEAVIQPTTRGRDAITLLRSRSLRGLSVGFEPTSMLEDAKERSVVYTSADLLELSLTPLPAYSGAAVTATRNREDHPMPDTTVDVAALLTRIDQLEARSLEVREPPRRAVSVREAWALQFRDRAATGQFRALADVLSSGNAGVLPPDWVSQVRDDLDAMRYLIPRLGQVAFPSSGYTLTWPKITQHTLVGPRGAEKTEIPSRALTTGSDVYSAVWYAGGVDVALELILQSDPAIQGIVVQDLRSQYAIATDQGVTSAITTAATPSGAALDFTNYGAFVAGVMAASEDIRVATGQPGDRLGLTTASWSQLIGLTDGDGRRILSTGGGTNADGAASLVATSVNVGGIQVFHNPRATEDIQFNELSAKVAEKPPLQITSDNVTLMGRDFGILGAVISLPLIPAGIITHSLTATTTTQGEGRGEEPRGVLGRKRG